MTIQFLDEVPTIARAGGPRALAPEVVAFLEALEQNPGKWAEFPGDRKTKPILETQYEVVGRSGKWYVSYVGPDADAAESETEEL